MGRTQIVAVVTSALLLFFVLELVRRRKLREEYSWLWLLMAFGYLLFSLVPGLINSIGTQLGTVRPTELFEFLGIFFLVLICIQFSVRLSRLTDRNRRLAQQIAILDTEFRESTKTVEEDSVMNIAAVQLEEAGD